MVCYEVHSGAVGVGRSSADNLYLLQASEGEDQARVVLSEQDVRRLIEDLQALLEGNRL